jgi:hypothetical protein
VRMTSSPEMALHSRQRGKTSIIKDNDGSYHSYFSTFFARQRGQVNKRGDEEKESSFVMSTMSGHTWASVTTHNHRQDIKPSMWTSNFFRHEKPMEKMSPCNMCLLQTAHHSCCISTFCRRKSLV